MKKNQIQVGFFMLLAAVPLLFAKMPELTNDPITQNWRRHCRRCKAG